MFYRYEVRNNKKEDILYLYLTMNYEFSKDMNTPLGNKKLTDSVKEFINNNSITFSGDKIYLVVDGIIIKTLDLKDNRKLKENTTTTYSNDSYIINLDYKGKMIKLDLRSYLLGVLATNSINDLELTTLKCLTLLYRTYAYKKMQEDGFILAENMFQLYKPISYYKLIWQDKYNEIVNKLNKAITDTDGEFIAYNNEYILPFIHICNNGVTSSSDIYPYIEKRTSLWDYSSPYYIQIKDFSYKQLKELLNLDKDSFKKIEIVNIDGSNHVENIKIDNKVFSGKTFRNILNLRSRDINIIINPTYIRCITKGWGEGLGLSQFGANEIAKVGCNYTSIIKYYFPKTIIKKYVKK